MNIEIILFIFPRNAHSTFNRFVRYFPRGKKLHRRELQIRLLLAFSAYPHVIDHAIQVHRAVITELT